MGVQLFGSPTLVVLRIFFHPVGFRVGKPREIVVSLWIVVSFLPWNIIHLRASFSRGEIIEAAPVFKFTYLVLGPTVMWVQSTMLTNPTKSDAMTFGQVRNG
jgi:hypothetical protein